MTSPADSGRPLVERGRPLDRQLGDLVVAVDRALELEDLGSIYLAREAVIEFCRLNPDAAWLLVELATVDDVALRKEVGRIMDKLADVAPGIEGEFATRILEHQRARMEELPVRLDQLAAEARVAVGSDRGLVVERIVQLHGSTEAGLDALVRLAHSGPDTELRAGAIAALGAVEAPGRRAAIEPFLEDPDHRIRKAALHAAARTGEDWAVEVLERAAGEPGLARFVRALLRKPGEGVR